MRSRVLIKQVTYVCLSLVLLRGGLYLFMWGFSTLDRIYKNSPKVEDYWSIWDWQNADSAYNTSHFAEMLAGWAAFPAGGAILLLSLFSALCSLSVTKSEREKDQRRKAEEEQRRLEAERNYVESLIGETRSMLESEERDATKAKNDAWLIAVKFTQSELDKISQLFQTGETSVSEAKKGVLFLKEQAEILNNPPHEGVPEETPYGILGVSPEATQNEIKKAYKRKIDFYHPDRHKNESESNQRYAEEMTKKINIAYYKLTKGKGDS